ncbi:hypothetical protein I3J09_26830 [Streptomyces clavuligerus]|nr:hypothetical protein [Streptomyces clavuligerus]MBY6306277.1 hypothetical protein [Streptomyces clavuligerus]QPL66119.1 hypothetical protein I3J04_26815 [Streptomyces clavuligerus]QPL71777.1 hypothetical protein I3J05_24740 [Streptomyces clavuligerus]QPL78231.1 hypothetical protein I3J06_26830 [Streptomyces clavuligerus]QPL84256.1 hypothetical protein I3J07_26865 [Streptomyces clavuligerus]
MPWQPGPGGQWVTLAARRKILAVVHTVPYAKRLLDVLALLKEDFRLQTVFTAPPHAFGDGVPSFLARLGSPVLPWDEALRTDFDLALAAGPRGVERLRAPLITLPHGANYVKRVITAAGSQVAGLRPADLTPGGRLPAAVVVPHHADLTELARSCPDVLPLTHVVGDPVHDRITASLPLRSAYRAALGVTDAQKLVVAISTWGPSSSFGRFETLLPRLITELPPEEYRTAVLVHPNIWSGHSPWQVRTWLGRWIERGVALLPPAADWRSVLIAADRLIGDHGSVTLYGTLTGAPMLLAASPEHEINPASPAAALAVTAPALSPVEPLAGQLEYAAAEYRPEEYAAISSRITSEPGRFNRNMRFLMYRLLRLGQPAHPPATVPLPAPHPMDSWAATGWEAPV